MKTVGKQLQEARLAKNWTPELAARETKIKVDRLRDLESDDYSHFSSPTYARGFVRTYARALGLDEYRILRQLDNKLPDDDSANIVTDTGVAYLPETAMPPRAAHRDYTGLYVVVALGGVVIMISTFVLFEAYRVGELSRWFAGSTSSETIVTATAGDTNTVATAPTPSSESPARALPVDSNTPPPIADTNTAPTNAPADMTASTTSPRALPVDPSLLGSDGTNAPTADAPVQAVRALPVDPSELKNAAPVTPVPAAPAPPSDSASVAPRALPVDPSELGNAAPTAPAPNTMVAMNNVQPLTNAPVAPVNAPIPPTPVPSSSARQSNNGPVMMPAPAPVPAAIPAPTPAAVPPTNLVTPPADAAPVVAPAPETTPQAATDSSSYSDKRLVLTASQDSFVRVTNLDTPEADKPLYAAVLHSGQSIGFDGRKFSINVGIPSAVDIKLDGVNYGPHSDQDAPETFTVQSHLP